MSTLAYALEALCKYAESETVDRRPKDKHGPIGRKPVARIDVADLRGLMTLHTDAPPVDREALWEAVVKVRDASPRVPNDADTEEIVDAVLAVLNGVKS